jgi:hypothetical protein
MCWRYVISMAFFVCVSSVSAAESDVAAILALRSDSNAGLLAHDADRVLLHTTDDFILVGGTSGGHVGKSVVPATILMASPIPILLPTSARRIK